MNYNDLLNQLSPEAALQLGVLAQEYQRRQAKEVQLSEWEPLKHQDDLSKSEATFRGIIGGNRTGKTEWGAREAYYYLTGTHPYKSIQVPTEIWIGTPSFDTQIESAQPKLLKFLKPEQIANTEYYQGNKIKTIYLKNGSRATFKSYEQATDKWAGAEKRLIWFDEEPPRPIWNEAIVRQGRDVKLDVIFTLTPVNGMTWFYDEIWLQAQAKHIDIKTPRWEDNPYLSPEQIQTMESMLSPEEIEVRKFGRFVRSGAGYVCPWWRRDLHLMSFSNFDPRAGSIYVAIDFGFAASNLCAIFVSIQKDDIYVFDGIYEKGMTTPALAQRLKEKLGDLYITKWIGDSEAASDIEELRQHGFPIEPIKKVPGTGSKNWDDYRARKMQEVGQVNQLTGRPRLHVNQDLIGFIDGRYINWFAREMESVLWKSIRSADGTKSVAIWSDDKPKDAIDAFSYIVVSLPMQADVKYVRTYERKRLIPKERLFDEDGFYL